MCFCRRFLCFSTHFAQIISVDSHTSSPEKPLPPSVEGRAVKNFFALFIAHIKKKQYLCGKITT